MAKDIWKNIKFIAYTSSDLLNHEVQNFFGRKDYYSTVKNSDYFNNKNDRKLVSTKIDELLKKQYDESEDHVADTVELSNGDKINIQI